MMQQDLHIQIALLSDVNTKIVAASNLEFYIYYEMFECFVIEVFIKFLICQKPYKRHQTIQPQCLTESLTLHSCH